MKTKLLCITACLTMLLCAVASGCQPKEGNPSSSDVSTTATTVDARPLISEPESGQEVKIGFDKRELANPNVKLFLPYEPSDDIKAQIAAYEEKYGGKVEVITCLWDVRITRLAQLIQSGDSPDVVSVVYSDMPTFAVKNLLEPIDGLTDLDNKVYLQEANDGIYSLDGKHYALTTFSMPYAIFFNRSMFKRAAVKAPDEYYKEGNWNWETFRQVSLEMSEDTDDDGINDVYGFGTWRDDVFLISNGTDLIKMEDGYPILNTSDAKVQKGLQLFQDMFVKDQSIQKEHWGWYDGFKNKKVAMVFEGADYQISLLLKDGFTDEIGIVPFPKGPDASEQINYTANTGFGLAKDSKNREGGAAFIEEYLTAAYKNITSGGTTKHLNDEQYNMLKSMLDQKMVLPMTTGFGDFSNKFFLMTDDLRADKPVGTILEQYAPELQAEINKTLGTAG